MANLDKMYKNTSFFTLVCLNVSYYIKSSEIFLVNTLFFCTLHKNIPPTTDS